MNLFKTNKNRTNKISSHIGYVIVGYIITNTSSNLNRFGANNIFKLVMLKMIEPIQPNTYIVVVSLLVISDVIEIYNTYKEYRNFYTFNFGCVVFTINIIGK